jgi:histidinol-phosphate aminotransferase
MAIYHVNHVFPNQNDLINFENIRLQSESKPLQSYSPATSLQKIIENRFEPSQVLKLDWNEGVIPPPVSVRTAMVEFIAKADGHYLKWYPNLGGGEDLRNKLAEYTGAIPENILVTNGSDDALILICQTFLGEGKVAVAPMPTYEHFCVNAENSGATLIRLELEDFLTSSPDEIAAAVEKHHPSVVYLISPNNPTGAHWDIPAVSNLATRYPDVIFICDEAYHEFARIDPKTGKPVTCVSLVQDLQNVIITRTFSKAFCLASLRVGYVVTHPNTVERLRIRYNPKSVNSLAQVAAYQALVEFESYYKPYITVTNNARENFVKDLQQGGFIVKSGGGGNFVCVGIPQSKISQVTKKLEEKSIFVRDISARVPGFIRISIGEDMSRVRDALLSLIGELNLF